MARFHVGQWVRLVQAFNPNSVGLEGRITEIFAQPIPTIAWPVECRVDWGRKTEGFGCAFFQLEPIQDPGHQKISWEEMADLWTPEKVGA